MSIILSSQFQGGAPTANQFTITAVGNFIWDVPGEPRNYIINDLSLTGVRLTVVAAGAFAWNGMIGFLDSPAGVITPLQTFSITNTLTAAGFYYPTLAIQRSFPSPIIAPPSSNIVITTLTFPNLSSGTLSLDLSGFTY